MLIDCVQIRRGSFQRPRLAFFTRDRVEAGCELTYDYGAAGSAGGAASQGEKRNLDSSCNNSINGSPQQQPMRKTPRRQRQSRSSESVDSTRPGEISSPQGNGSLSPKMDEQQAAWATGGSNGRWKSDDGTHCQQALSMRRPCLCGSWCCRSFLPCNRAIL